MNLVRVFRGLVLTVLATGASAGQPLQSPPDDLWPCYGRDPGGSRYSPLAEINTTNIHRLKPAWTFRTGEIQETNSASAKAAFEATPIFVDGTLFFSTPFNRIFAVDPSEGKPRWRFDPKLQLSSRMSEVTSRGVSTWADPKPGAKIKRRIFLGTLDARLLALDAATGELCTDFGANGQVDLSKGVRIASRTDYQVTSPPAIIDDLVVVGSSIGDNRGVKLERGVVRAYDARTGGLRWSWDPIPTDPSDPAAKTWKGNSAIETGAANAWSIISVDHDRHLVFVPSSSPSPDFYGGERIGDNLYANSVVAIDSRSGKVVWHFQAIHHDVWDYDIASQPMLINVRQNGGEIPAVVVGTKVGHLFVLHRETGKPIFPIEERSVPQSDVPGEQTALTQPFPANIPSLAPQRFTAADAWGPTPAQRESAREFLKDLRSEGPFTPPSLGGSILFPGNIGGMHWGGMCFDPIRGFVIANVNRIPTVATLFPREEHTKLRATPEGQNRIKGETGWQNGTPYIVQREIIVTPEKLPLNPPPWGTIAAVNLNKPAIEWEVPLGYFPHLSQYSDYQKWGSVNLGGAITTAGGLTFVAATFDNHLRAFNTQTGVEIWKHELPASAQATPMTYRMNGRQYLVICAGGHAKIGTKLGDFVVAFAIE